MWTMGNLAGHSLEVRDLLLESSSLNYLTVISEQWTAPIPDEETLNAMNWVLTNLCNKERFPRRHLAPLLKILSDLCKHCDALEDVCWICFDLTERFKMDTLIADDVLLRDYNDAQNTYLVAGYLRAIDLNQHIIPDDVIRETLTFHSVFALKIRENPMAAMIGFLRHKSSEIRDVALKVVGNIVAAGTASTDYAMTHGLLEQVRVIHRFGQTDKADLYWMLSNVCAGSPAHIEAVIQQIMMEGTLIDTLIDPRSDYKVAVNAFYAVSNAIYGAQQRQIELLLRCNVMFAIFQFLKRVKQNADLLLLVLGTIEHFLASLGGGLRNQLLDRCNALGVLGELRNANLVPKAQATIDKILSHVAV